MRWILTAVCLAAVCSGCRSGERHVVGPPTCAARITWNGTVYYGETFSSLPPATLELGTGGRPTCGGVNGGEAGASSTVEVRRLIGVDPRVAVAVNGEPSHAREGVDEEERLRAAAIDIDSCAGAGADGARELDRPRRATAFELAPRPLPRPE